MEELGSAVVEERQMYTDRVGEGGFGKRWNVVHQHSALHGGDCTVGLVPIVGDSLHMLMNQ